MVSSPLESVIDFNRFDLLEDSVFLFVWDIVLEGVRSSSSSGGDPAEESESTVIPLVAV